MATANSKLATTGKPVWFITGCSTGIGRVLAKYVLKCGYRAVLTDCDLNGITDLAANGDALVLKLDITDQGQIDEVIKEAEKKFGRIDVLANNAGICYFSSVEESEEDQVRRMFEINVFGLSRMIHAVLPGMRKRRKGFIVNLSCVGGLRSFPSIGYYYATKFAVEGLSEALWQEVEPLGIKVMLVEPSGFRTDWSIRSSNESKRQIRDYAAMAGAWSNQVRTISGRQPGDPVRAAHVIVKATESLNPPHRLLLGNDAYEAATKKIEELRKEFSAWESVSRIADFPKDMQGQTAWMKVFMYQTILVPLDGSPRAESILPYVENQALQFKSKVIFLQVWTAQEAISHKNKEMISKYLASIQEGFQKKGIESICFVEMGDAVETILSVAQRENADLVAIASHGRSGLSRVFYGSVAAGIMQKIDRPMLVIRSRNK